MMKRRLISLIVIAAMLLSGFTPVYAAGSDQEKNLDKTNVIDKLSGLSDGKLKLSDENGQIFLSGKLSDKKQAGEKAALQFLQENRALFELSDAAKELKSLNVRKSDLGDTFARFEQTIEGIPVEDGQLNVHFDKEGVIVSVNGRLNKDKKIDNLGSTEISAQDAIEIAIQQLGGKTPSQDPTAEKVVITEDKKNYAVYKVNIYLGEPDFANDDVYVELYSGKVLRTESNVRYDGPTTGTGVDVQGITRNLQIYQSGATYQLRNIVNPATSLIITYDCAHSTETGNVVASSSTAFTSENYKASVSAHYFAGRVLDFYRNLFGRNSLDGHGLNIKSFTHFGTSYNNAFWDGVEMVYGDGDGSMFTYCSGDLDVVGHEMTHGVIDHSADLVYHNQSGALNESLADTFGVLVETYDKYNVTSSNMGAWRFDAADWVIADKIYTPADPNDALRSMSDPSLYGQPGTMSEYENQPDTENGDWGGVHDNSGIPNKAAFLIAQSLGMEKTAKIYYRALLYYMGAYTDFNDAKDCLVQSATDLYGSAAATAVANAFQSVGIGVPFDTSYEPNDTFASAYPIDLGTTYRSTISSMADSDYYVFKVAAGDIHITLTDLSVDYDLYLYDANGVYLTRSYNSGSQPEAIDCHVSAAGIYYAKVVAYASPDPSWMYSLTVLANSVPVAGISLNNHTANLPLGGTIALSATVSPPNATDKTFKWSSSDTQVAIVNTDGKMTAVGKGTATITARTVSGNFADTCIVRVAKFVTGVTVSPTTLYLHTRAAATLTATVLPADADNKSVNWSSSDSAKATVDSSGKVLGVAPGVVTITATTADGGFKQSCTVTVTDHIAVSGVALDKHAASLFLKESVPLIATVSPASADNKAVAWTSSNNSVATVTSAGVVTAVGAAGTAVITAKTAEGNFTDSCTVTVTAPASMKAASSAYNAVKLTWGPIAGASGYEVYRSTSSTGTYSYVATATAATLTNTGLVMGSTYYYKVRAFKNGATKLYSPFSAIASAKPVLSPPATFKAAAASYNSIKITWSAVAGAAKYELYRATSSTGKYTLLITTTATSYTNTKVNTGTAYYYKLRVYRQSGSKKIYSAYTAIVSAKTVLATPTAPKAAVVSYSSVKLSWNAVAGATKYEVYRATSSTGKYTLLTTTSAKSYTNTKLNTGTAYFYKIRAYRTVASKKVYSGFTAVVSAKPVLATPTSVKAVRVSSSSIKISWRKVAGATKYEIYRGVSYSDTLMLLTTTSSTSFTHTGLLRGTTYLYVVRAYRQVGKTRIYSNWSSIVYATP